MSVVSAHYTFLLLIQAVLLSIQYLFGLKIVLFLTLHHLNYQIGFKGICFAKNYCGGGGRAKKSEKGVGKKFTKRKEKGEKGKRLKNAYFWVIK